MTLLFLVAGRRLPVIGQEETGTELRYRLSEGQTFQETIKRNLKLEGKVPVPMENDDREVRINVDLNNSIKTRTGVTGNGSEGNTKLKVKIYQFSIDFQSNIGTIRYSSSKDTGKYRTVFRPVVDSPFYVTITPGGEVKNITNLKKHLEKSRDAVDELPVSDPLNDQMLKTLLKSMMSKEYFRTLVKKGWPTLPENVKKGREWKERRTVLRFPAGIAVQTRRDYRYGGTRTIKEREVHVIESRGWATVGGRPATDEDAKNQGRVLLHPDGQIPFRNKTKLHINHSDGKATGSLTETFTRNWDAK